MQKTKSKRILGLGIIVIAFAYFILFSNNENESEIPVETIAPEENRSRISDFKSEKKIENSPSTPILEKCNFDQYYDVDEFSYPLWEKFKTDIYLQGIRYPVFRLAIHDTPPLSGTVFLTKNPLKTTRLIPISYSEPEFTKNFNTIIGTLLSRGVQGLFSSVENGDMPESILTQSSSNTFQLILIVSSKIKSENVLPTEKDLLSLIDYGLEISFNDYYKATELSLPENFIEMLVSLGPEPTSFNNLSHKLPINLAAEKGNLELVKFWYNKDLIHTGWLTTGNFADQLLLNSTNSTKLAEYWNYLTEIEFYPRDPKTAQTILSSKRLSSNNSLKQFLKKLAVLKKVQVSLSDSDKIHYQNAVTEIKKINDVLDKKYPGFFSCIKKKNDNINSSEILLSKERIFKLLNEGKTLEEILELLTKESSHTVELFRSKMNSGWYQPLLNPATPTTLISEAREDQKALGFLINGEWDSLKKFVKLNSLDDKTKFLLLSEKSAPDDIKKYLISQLNSIPIGNFREAVSVLSVEDFEKLNLDSNSLNRINGSGKNIFFYASKKNNTPLMEWLVKQDVDMSPDPYGTDPLEEVLKFNVNPQTLSTLCVLGFPIENKHKKLFEDIRDEDPAEADEILINCPAFEE